MVICGVLIKRQVPVGVVFEEGFVGPVGEERVNHDGERGGGAAQGRVGDPVYGDEYGALGWGRWVSRVRRTEVVLTDGESRDQC